ncbi:MAG: hypothetical protein COB53_13350 [Elusimicrobia bacterium]|nr:MAG: hypothetical protein COB53_13350 [Elusimicrobiota bacterium]
MAKVKEAIPFWKKQPKDKRKEKVEDSDIRSALEEAADIEIDGIAKPGEKTDLYKRLQTARSRTLSISSIKLYDDCPRKWYFRYVHRIPQKDKHFFFFGKLLHELLEYFYKQPVVPALKDILGMYNDWWDNGKAGKLNPSSAIDWPSADQEAKYRADGERILKEYYEKHAPTFKPAFHTERHFVVRLWYAKSPESSEWMVHFEKSTGSAKTPLTRPQGFESVPLDNKDIQVQLQGYIDRIERHENGFEIIDYKTGKPFDNDRVEKEEQMTLYQMACDNDPALKVDSENTTVASLTLYHLNSLTAHTVHAHSSDKVAALKSKIADVHTGIRSSCDNFIDSPLENFELKPDERKCDWCEYEPICPLMRGLYVNEKLIKLSASGQPQSDLFAGKPRRIAKGAAIKSAAETEGTKAKRVEKLIDKLGKGIEDLDEKKLKVEEMKKELIGSLRELGYVKVYGTDFQGLLHSADHWEFTDRNKSKVKELLKEHGLFDRIMGPSIFKVREMIRTTEFPAELCEKLESLEPFSRNKEVVFKLIAEAGHAEAVKAPLPSKLQDLMNDLSYLPHELQEKLRKLGRLSREREALAVKRIKDSE